MKRLILIFLLLLVGCSAGIQQKKHADSTVADMPFEDVSSEEIEALGLAINDEYKAQALYQKVISKFGDVKPFSSIVQSEGVHIAELKEVYSKYSLDVPQDDWYDQVPEFDTLADACAAGVQAEIDNVALYDGLFSKVDNQDITEVFTSLRDASLNKHLPAFQRCSSRP